MNCAICDDDKGTVDAVNVILKNILRENECAGNICTYTDSRSLILDLTDYKPIDLAIIDIEMPYYNGLQVAKEIKTRFPECYIIFLTSYIKYAVEAYEFQIFRYTPKSEIETKLPRYIDEAVKLINLQNGRTYTVVKNEILERLPYNQMLYVSKEGKYAVITCIDGREIRVRKSLHEVFDELDQNEFVIIDRGYIVNLAFISRICDHEVVFKNDVHLSISRYKLKETKLRVARYWGEKM